MGSDISTLIYSMTEDQRNDLYRLIDKMKSEGLDDKLLKSYSDITCDDVLEEIKSTTSYERKRKLKSEASEKGETTIPKEKWGVHNTHCCSKHGCKYGDEDCPVSIGISKQKYPCEYCEDCEDFEDFEDFED